MCSVYNFNIQKIMSSLSTIIFPPPSPLLSFLFCIATYITSIIIVLVRIKMLFLSSPPPYSLNFFFFCLYAFFSTLFWMHKKEHILDGSIFDMTLSEDRTISSSSFNFPKCTRKCKIHFTSSFENWKTKQRRWKMKSQISMEYYILSSNMKPSCMSSEEIFLLTITTINEM